MGPNEQCILSLESWKKKNANTAGEMQIQTHNKRKQKKKETFLKFPSFHFSGAWFVKDVER